MVFVFGGLFFVTASFLDTCISIFVSGLFCSFSFISFSNIVVVHLFMDSSSHWRLIIAQDQEEDRDN